MSKSGATRLVQLSRTSSTRKSQKIDKSSALYVHFSGEEYDCDECAFWLTDKRCVIHRSNFDVRSEDSCGFMVQGRPDTFAGKPFLNMDPKTTGFTRNIEGGGCRNCIHFGSSTRDCDRVDRGSSGDDPGEIHPDACCALQEKK
ncbi:MAG: hypothetical protein KGL39_34445 [Patescibacteria group bacterium]|nr:hypothetical protein [Patescibacteria group bacterium]